MIERKELDGLMFYWRPDEGVCLCIIKNGVDIYYKVSDKQAFKSLSDLATATGNVIAERAR